MAPVKPSRARAWRISAGSLYANTIASASIRANFAEGDIPCLLNTADRLSKAISAPTTLRPSAVRLATVIPGSPVLKNRYGLVCT